MPLNGRNATQLMQLVAGVLTDRTDLALQHDLPRHFASLIERCARQYDELRAGRRLEADHLTVLVDRDVGHLIGATDAGHAKSPTFVIASESGSTR